MPPVKTEKPGPGQESVWDYPRPPRVEATAAHLRVEHGGQTVAETTRGLRVLETSHPPVFYFPPEDVQTDFLVPTPDGSFCEFKGRAVYWDVLVGGHRAERAAWSYPAPSGPFAALKDHVAFYADRVDACWVDGERVTPQPGNFYGGWITSKVAGPFKGAAGTWGW